MNKIVLFFLGIMLFYSCDKTVFQKPENLVSRSKMVKMLVDIHIAEGTFNNRKYQDSLLAKSKSGDFYQSILKKYNCPDSVFEKSFVYYASEPKKFEKMYREVVNKLNEMEQFYSDQKTEINLREQPEKQ